MIEQIYQMYEGRPYHNAVHLAQVRVALSQFVDIDEKLDMAILYHDAVYVPGRRDNEERSAAMACNAYPQYAAFLQTAIMATALHQRTGDHLIDLFLDADMSILGMPWGQYDAYRKGVRREYAMFDDEQFREGRKQFLLSFSGFITDEFNDAYLEQAKRNIERELKELEG